MKTTGSVALLGLMLLSCLSDFAAADFGALGNLFTSAAGSVATAIADKFQDFSCEAQSFPGGIFPTGCPRNREPVCGTNGVTYNNVCELCKANSVSQPIGKKHDGNCVSQVDCTGHVRSAGGSAAVPCAMTYTPICGTDGVTYSNKCQFCNAVANGQNLNVRHWGSCSQIDCDMFRASVCPATFEPVCGSDGNTYGNACMFCQAFMTSRGTLSFQRYGSC